MELEFCQSEKVGTLQLNTDQKEEIHKSLDLVSVSFVAPTEEANTEPDEQNNAAPASKSSYSWWHVCKFNIHWPNYRNTYSFSYLMFENSSHLGTGYSKHYCLRALNVHVIKYETSYIAQ